MAINFAAESMQGYNNPQIEIVNVELDGHGALITPITFDDIAKILARGVFPIVSLWSVGKDEIVRNILPMSYARDGEIVFSTIIMHGTPDSPASSAYGLKFAPSGPPVVIWMPLMRAPN